MSKIDSWITKIPRLKNSKVARFSYKAEAYANDDIEGVENYDYSRDMNVPLATHTDFDSSMLSVGARANFSSIPKNGLNHFFGRVSYNLNKVIDFISDLLDDFRVQGVETIHKSTNFTLGTYYDGKKIRIANTHATNTITCTLPSGQTMNGNGTISIPAGRIIDIELIGSTWKDNLTGDLVGNADTSDKWKTARNIRISDADGTNTGSAVSVDGSENETLKLPATIKANLTGNASTATAPLYQWKKSVYDLFRYAPGESPDKTYYWFRVCKITTAMTFDLELFSDENLVRRASYRLSVSAYSTTVYTVALLNLGQTDGAHAKLAVALDADGYLYIQTNCEWTSYLHVTLLYSASSNFSITMDKLGYAPFGTESGFTPVKIITQTGGFRVENGAVTYEYSPIIHTNIIGNVTGNADTATKLANARKINGVSFDGSDDITVEDSTKEPAFTKNTAFNKNFETTASNIKANGTQSVGSSSNIPRADHVHPTDTSRAPLASPAFTGTPTINGGTVWHSGNDGSGSGLDADLLDGQHGSYYAPINNPTFTGTVTAPTLVGNVTGNLSGNASTATAPLYQWKKSVYDLFRYAPGESPDKTYYWFRVCKITTAMTFDLELFSDENLVRRASYRLSVSAYSTTVYTVALLNLGQTSTAEAKLAVALDADGYLYIQTNCLWNSYLHVTLLYSASSDFSITMNKLGYAAFGSASGFTPVKIITQTGGFRVADGVASGTVSPIIHTNIIGNVTGNADTASNADLLDGQHGSYYAPLASPALTGSPTAPTPATATNNTQIATTAFVKAQLLAAIYPIGCYYTQYPNANSNDDAIEFPISQRPATLFGGTWEEQWANESIFFRTRGTLSNTGRTNGKQEDQMQGHVHTGLRLASVSDGYANSGTTRGNVNADTSVPKTDGTNGTPRTGTETRSVNRRIKVWKRIA